MIPKKNDKALYIFFGILIYAVAVVLAFNAGKIMDGGEASIMTAFLSALTRMTVTPFDFMPVTSNGLKCAGLVTFIAFFGFMSMYINQERNKNTMPGKESGTAKWNTNLKDYNKKYSDPPGIPDNSGPNNMILSDSICLNMDTTKTRFNNNIIVIGGSGSGKSRFFVKPNLLQANCDYIVTDPSGELSRSTAKFLEDRGYEIKIFNLVEMNKSLCYNPFNYVRNEEDVLTMIDCLIANTESPNKKGGDQFWEKSEKALLQALCFYLINYCKKEDQNFTTVMKLLRAAEVDENNPDKKSPLDIIFDSIKQSDPDSIAVKSYMTFKMGAGKTLKSILISCAVRLQVFNIQAVANLTSVDTINLESMGTGDKKKALFVITPQASSTYNFLVSMLYSQLFETLYYIGDTDLKSLKRQIRFLLDEFVNIGQIPQFTKKLATMRKYGISCSIIIQNVAQLKPLYEDWETILGNCDSLLFLGGSEYSTLEYMSNILGTATIKTKNTSKSIGGKGSHSISHNSSSRKLLNPDEVGNISNQMCIIKIRSLDPFMTKKYDYPRHPNYKYTGDADPENIYINKFDNSKPSLLKDLVHKAVAGENDRSFNPLQFRTDIMSLQQCFKAFDFDSASDLFDRFSVYDSFAPDTDSEIESLATEAIVAATGKERMVKIIAEYKEKKLKNALASQKMNADTGSDESAPQIIEAVAETAPEILVDAAQNWVFT